MPGSFVIRARCTRQHSQHSHYQMRTNRVAAGNRQVVANCTGPSVRRSKRRSLSICPHSKSLPPPFGNGENCAQFSRRFQSALSPPCALPNGEPHLFSPALGWRGTPPSAFGDVLPPPPRRLPWISRVRLGLTSSIARTFPIFGWPARSSLIAKAHATCPNHFTTSVWSMSPIAKTPNTLHAKHE